MNWRRIVVVSALLLVLAPVCLCVQQPVNVAQGQCEGMPAQSSQGSTPACCSISPSPQPLLTVSIQNHGPSMTASQVISGPELSLPEQIDYTPLVSLAQSPPHSSSILRI